MTQRARAAPFTLSMKSLWDLPLATLDTDSAALPPRRAHTGPCPVKGQRYGLALTQPLPEATWFRLTFDLSGQP